MSKGVRLQLFAVSEYWYEKINAFADILPLLLLALNVILCYNFG